MHTKKVLFITAIVGLCIGVVLVTVLMMAAQNAVEKREAAQLSEDSVSSESVPDAPIYMDPAYHKEERENFVYNVDMSEVDIYSLPMDADYLVTSDDHSGENGYVNIVYITLAYALNVYFDGEVDGVYTYAEEQDLTLIGDTTSVYDVRLHGPRELLVKVNGFDSTVLVTEVTD